RPVRSPRSHPATSHRSTNIECADGPRRLVRSVPDLRPVPARAVLPARLYPLAVPAAAEYRPREPAVLVLGARARLVPVRLYCCRKAAPSEPARAAAPEAVPPPGAAPVPLVVLVPVPGAAPAAGAVPV